MWLYDALGHYYAIFILFNHNNKQPFKRGVAMIEQNGYCNFANFEQLI